MIDIDDISSLNPSSSCWSLTKTKSTLFCLSRTKSSISRLVRLAVGVGCNTMDVETGLYRCRVVYHTLMGLVLGEVFGT